MTAAAETGRAGERAATEYLRRAGYEICALNWRQGRYEPVSYTHLTLPTKLEV